MSSVDSRLMSGGSDNMWRHFTHMQLADQLHRIWNHLSIVTNALSNCIALTTQTPVHQPSAQRPHPIMETRRWLRTGKKDESRVGTIMITLPGSRCNVWVYAQRDVILWWTYWYVCRTWRGCRISDISTCMGTISVTLYLGIRWTNEVMYIHSIRLHKLLDS